MENEERVGMGKRITEQVTGSVLWTIVIVLALGTYARNSIWRSEIELWKDCVRKAPHKDRSHHNLGYAYYEDGRLEEAQKEFEEALALNPSYTLSLYNLGLVFYQKGMTQNAIDWYEKALKQDRPYPETYYNLGLAYYQEGLYLDSVNAFRTFLKMKPDYENAYNNLGLAYQRLKQWDQAKEAFQEELKRNPENLHTPVYLGELYYELKDDRMALVYLKKALALPHLSDPERIKKIVFAIEKKKGKKNKQGIR